MATGGGALHKDARKKVILNMNSRSKMSKRYLHGIVVVFMVIAGCSKSQLNALNFFCNFRENLDANGITLGAAYTDIPCWAREKRVAIIRSGTTHKTGAHELAHLLSNIHDDDDIKCQNETRIMKSVVKNDFNSTRWSACSRNKFFTYFRDIASMCMDNCPSTVKKCFTPRVPSCVNLPSNVCFRNRYNYIDKQIINCREDLQCEDVLHVPGRRVSVPIADWTVADCNAEGVPTIVCYAGLDVPYALAPPMCDSVDSL